MDVLMIDHFSPANTYSEELAAPLSGHVQLSVACQENANRFAPGVRQLSVLYSNGAPKLKAICRYIRGQFRLYRELKSGKYQIAHVQTFKLPAMEIGLYKRACKDMKLVHTVHNLLPHEAKKSDVALYSSLYARCDALIVHNEVCKRQLIGDFHIDSKKIHVIAHGAYSVRPALPRKQDDGKLHFLMFGVIRRYKGIDILLKAIAQIPWALRQQMEFIIAGKQYMNQHPVDYEAMIRELGIADCTRLMNRRMDDEELRALFGWADACLFPYREIYGSGALLMAYSYGKPVIASDVPAFVEETDGGRTGILFERESPAALAKALEAFAAWTEGRKAACTQAIAELVEGKYNWKTSAQKTAEVYERILG